MAYTHLTDDCRYSIYELKGKGHGVREIARLIGRDKSTISRELRRNKGERGYRPNQASKMASERLHEPRGGKKVDPAALDACMALIAQDYSPEQASGRCKKEGLGSVSHELLYQKIYDDKAAGGTLAGHLRCQKKRRKRYGSHRRRGSRIPNRVSIADRCKRVKNRATIGHWEGDLVIGKNHKCAIVTLVERRSGFALARKIETKDATSVADAIVAAMADITPLVRSITFDNGLEFAQHERIAACLNAKMYFADPYCSWQRGTNENWNGLLRQYFPKKSCFEAITKEDLAKAERMLNDRARKRLDYLTPREVFMATANRARVALAN